MNRTLTREQEQEALRGYQWALKTAAKYCARLPWWMDRDGFEREALRAWRWAFRTWEPSKGAFSTRLYMPVKSALNRQWEIQNNQEHFYNCERLDEPQFSDEPETKAEGLADVRFTPAEQVEREEVRRLVREAVSELPERERLGLVLRYWGELPATQIKGYLGIGASSTCIWVLNRAEQRVGEELMRRGVTGL